MHPSSPAPCRVLVADDLPTIHEDYRKILAPPHVPALDLAGVPGFAKFASSLVALASAPDSVGFDLASVDQGDSAVALVIAARAEGRPFALAFVDVRMPPGIDGIETARRLRAADPALQIVICTAYSDRALDDLSDLFPEGDGLLILKKPFDPVEVLQLARSLTRKWTLAQDNAALIAELEARVIARTADLGRANQSLEAALVAAESANQAKARFLATMSHEIRTPLNAVLGMADLLEATDLSPAQREYAATIRTSGDALLSVLSSILDYSRLGGGVLALESAPFAPADCLQGALAVAAPPAACTHVRLAARVEPGLPPRLMGDVTRVRQILIHLVGNALKFTAQGHVEVVLGPTASPAHFTTVAGGVSGAPTPRGPRWRITVKDTGIGIPLERQAGVFEAFTQVDASTTRLHGGAGMGLALVARLVAHMGGVIYVDSRAGAGATFVVDLPLVEPPSPGAPATLPAPTRTLRVLIVEDHPVNLRVGELLLQRMGHFVAAVSDGSSALTRLERETFDIVLLDVQMQVIDGYEVARLICQRLPLGKRPWIIALTANAMAGDREACLSAGMDDYVSKPMRGDDLSAALARATSGLASRQI